MNAHWKHSVAAMAMGLALCIGAASCSSNKDGDSSLPGKSQSTVAVEEGKAGGVVVDTYTVTSMISDINVQTRQITLKGEDGKKIVITAGPEIRRFDQLRVGERVEAKLVRQLVVLVRSDGSPASSGRVGVVTVAPKGEKPGAMSAEVVEVVAKVESIDRAARTATLKFSDGDTRVVNVRPDVDLTRYKAGDSVVIRITEIMAVEVGKQ